MAERSPGGSARERPPAHDTVEELVAQRLSEMLGGWRGAVESAVPLVVFALVWACTSTLRTSLVAAVGSLALMLVIALLQQAPLRFIGYAAAGLALSAFFALRSGRASDAFLPGMVQNGITLTAMLIGNFARWPLLGFVVGAADLERFSEAPTWWRRYPGIVTVATRLGWVLVVLAVLRLAIMIPLYLANRASELAIAKVVLGWPAYLAAIAIMGALLLRGRTPLLEQPR